MWKCPNCGTENEGDPVYCGNCGHQNPASSKGSSNNSDPRTGGPRLENKGCSDIGIGSGLFLVCIAVTFSCGRYFGPSFIFCFIGVLIYSVMAKKPGLIAGFILGGVLSAAASFILLWIVCSGAHW